MRGKVTLILTFPRQGGRDNESIFILRGEYCKILMIDFGESQNPDLTSSPPLDSSGRWNDKGAIFLGNYVASLALAKKIKEVSK